MAINHSISDVKDGFDVFDFGENSIELKNGTPREVIIAENSTLTFTCGVCPKRSETLDIFLNGSLLQSGQSKCSNSFDTYLLYNCLKMKLKMKSVSFELPSNNKLK